MDEEELRGASVEGRGVGLGDVSLSLRSAFSPLFLVLVLRSLPPSAPLFPLSPSSCVTALALGVAPAVRAPFPPFSSLPCGPFVLSPLPSCCLSANPGRSGEDESDRSKGSGEALQVTRGLSQWVRREGRGDGRAVRGQLGWLRGRGGAGPLLVNLRSNPTQAPSRPYEIADKPAPALLCTMDIFKTETWTSVLLYY